MLNQEVIAAVKRRHASVARGFRRAPEGYKLTVSGGGLLPRAGGVLMLLLAACGGNDKNPTNLNRTTGGAAGAAAGSSAGGVSSAGASGGGTATATYTTNFDTTESPISEAGHWHHVGLDWTTVDTAGGTAFGTQALGVSRSGPTGYDDSYAYLDGFSPDQEASAVVSLGTIDTSCTHEVEVLLRWDDGAHLAQGYECNVAFDGSYAQIVRWNGAVGDYMYLGSGSVPGGVRDGDTVSARVTGGHITLSVNGTVRATADDATYPDGNPGIGFWRGDSGCGTLGDYGFTSFQATSLGP